MRIMPRMKGFSLEAARPERLGKTDVQRLTPLTEK
jgi:hypothetical protein